MFRTWPFWFTMLLLAASVGWFWMLSSDLAFSRAESAPKLSGSTATQIK